jgi:type 1 glutamine amidotransferase
MRLESESAAAHSAASMKMTLYRTLAALLILGGITGGHAASLKALIVDGQNNHDWKSTSPLLQRYLEETGLFEVDVVTTPAKGQDMSGFRPAFDRYDVVVSNYNGDEWPEPTKAAFEKFVREGGGFVPVHAANNAFGKWTAYNQMIGLGGWGGRNEKSGPYLYWDAKAKQVIKDIAAGRGGSHGAQHEFLVEARQPAHPILKGLPDRWLHAQDELYDRLRGPARDVTVLATAFADPKTRGSGRHEPMLMTVAFGKGRVFHTTLGHARGADAPAFHCVGFITTLQRGAEWAATGRVTQTPPADFPSADKVSRRD